MSEYSDLKLARFSHEDRELIKAGVLEAETLELTTDGKALLTDILFQANKKAVLDAVRSVRKDDKKNETKAQ